MSDREYSCPMLQQAEANDDGDLIYHKEITKRNGSKHQIEVNCTKLYQPGRRKLADVSHLVAEAHAAHNGTRLGNPGFPIDGDVAREVHERLPEDIEPAWVACTVREYP